MAADQGERTPRGKNDIGPVGQVVAENVRWLRDERHMTTRELAARLAELGRPILATGVTKLEAEQRRVDADDLVALAMALGVSPVRLLLPVGDWSKDVALTSEVTANQSQAWNWALVRSPLLAVLGDEIDDVDLRKLTDDFRRHSLPEDERLRDDHTAVKAAQDVLNRVGLVLERLAASAQPPDSGFRRAVERSPENTPAALRRAVARLTAEVDDLIAEVDVTGDDDGSR